MIRQFRLARILIVLLLCPSLAGCVKVWPYVYVELETGGGVEVTMIGKIEQRERHMFAEDVPIEYRITRDAYQLIATTEQLGWPMVVFQGSTTGQKKEALTLAPDYPYRLFLPEAQRCQAGFQPMVPVRRLAFYWGYGSECRENMDGDDFYIEFEVRLGDRVLGHERLRFSIRENGYLLLNDSL